MFYITHYINYYIHSINDSHEVSAHKHTQKHMITNIWAHTPIINNSNKSPSSSLNKGSFITNHQKGINVPADTH